MKNIALAILSVGMMHILYQKTNYQITNGEWAV